MFAIPKSIDSVLISALWINVLLQLVVTTVEPLAKHGHTWNHAVKSVLMREVS